MTTVKTALLICALAAIVSGCGGNSTEAAKLDALFASRGHNTTCTKTGVIAFAGGRSSLYKCTWKNVDKYQYETTVTRCAVWVDGSGYDVTRQARASAALSGEHGIC